MEEKPKKSLGTIQREWQKRAEAAEAAEASQASEKQPSKPFPSWNDGQRAIPNELARSALFCIQKEHGLEAVKNKEIFSQGNVDMLYTGPILTQDHLDVYDSVMHLARNKGENERIRFTRNELLRVLGRPQNGQKHDVLLDMLFDLAAAVVMIKSKAENGRKRIYFGSLMPDGSFDEKTGIYSVKINRKLIQFFTKGYTLIQWEQRKALARSPLAKHLHYWVMSHRKPYAVSVEYLYKLTGSTNSELRGFRRALKRALDKLVEVGAIQAWQIDKHDNVQITPKRKNKTLEE